MPSFSSQGLHISMISLKGGVSDLPQQLSFTGSEQNVPAHCTLTSEVLMQQRLLSHVNAIHSLGNY
jgi:hypothetical protein